MNLLSTLFPEVFCRHKWKFIRTESDLFMIRDVCECTKCGKRKGFKVW